MAVRLRVSGRVGRHLRTLSEGLVTPGDELVLLERPHPQWPVVRAFETIINARSDPESALQLARLTPLSAYQRRALTDPERAPVRIEVEPEGGPIDLTSRTGD